MAKHKRIDNVVWFRDAATVIFPERENIKEAVEYSNIKFTREFDKEKGDFWFDGSRIVDCLTQPVICNNGYGYACGIFIPFTIEYTHACICIHT